ncbi:MAG: carbamoyl-phosphate synthase large subunit [Clostridia bacterium]|nr:carbamoyl-phosphate synthase large subunit [Clostridia bacterium]
MPRNKDIKKVLLIGSGPIVIGQAAEFDYAGTQALTTLKNEGLEVVLVNSNPATIMTDAEMADRVYLEPLSVDVLKKIIDIEKPDSILPTLGGQTGLNLAMELAETGYLEEKNVKLLGTNTLAIKKAEDREAFKETMEKLNEPIVEGTIVTEVHEALEFADRVGYPVIVRPAYTLGGTGGGIADTKEQLAEICEGGLKASRVHQCLIEKCICGWKEIEFEAMRDSAGNCITICNMENVDPVGVHTGDSIVVAPVQTLRDEETVMLHNASLKIIEELGIEGGCNVQFALHPYDMSYAVIEVNPRVSRSSALASKATGYPIARVSTLVAIGYTLDEIKNAVTGNTYASFEPSIDYIVCKFPRWPFDKFVSADRKLGTKMKATGEVMSISDSFESAMLKSMRSLELNVFSSEVNLFSGLSKEQLVDRLHVQDDQRIFCVFAALRAGVSVQEVYDITKIDTWFLNKFATIIKNEEKIKAEKLACLDKEYMLYVKKLGFADKAIAEWCGVSEKEIRKMRVDMGIVPVYNTVDTCAGEYKAYSDYYYSTYQTQSEVRKTDKKTVVVLGSGPIRIGQGVEFDYCSVHCVWALKKLGYDAVIINNNPETVSTDFDTSDRLYFEPLTNEEVLNILEVEKPEGVFVQFGGQTAIKLAKTVHENGYKIFGTTFEDINNAEDREEFDALLTQLDLARPKGKTVFTAEQALSAAEELGYPVLVRPSYVLGGQGMEICYNAEDITKYMSIINLNTQEHPILVDQYIMGKELEVDAICDGKNILIPGIMEHVERTGVHSGDSIAVYPATLDKDVVENIIETTRKLAFGTKTVGLINIQYILRGKDLYIIEVNPRSSRTVPYISKVTGIPMVQLAVRCSLGEDLASMGYGTGLHPASSYYAVKVPVFSNEKIPDLEISLSPEMKSTGEVLGLSKSYPEALLKGLLASGIRLKDGGIILISVADIHKQEIVETAQAFSDLGFELYATGGTAHVLNKNFIPTNVIGKLKDKGDNIETLFASEKVCLVINTPTRGHDSTRDGFKIRRMAIERGITCMTAPDTANALAKALKLKKKDKDLNLVCLGDIKND